MTAPLTDAQLGAMRTFAGYLDRGCLSDEDGRNAAHAIRKLADEVARLRGALAAHEAGATAAIAAGVAFERAACERLVTDAAGECDVRADEARGDDETVAEWRAAMRALDGAAAAIRARGDDGGAGGV